MRTQDSEGVTAGEGGTLAAYTYVGSARTFRVNADQSTTPIVNVTAISNLYGVQFTWTVLAQTWDADGPAGVIPLKTEEVNAVCGHDHVQDFRTETDQGPSQVLYNYGVITVGPDEGLQTDEVRVRMDHLNDPSTFAAIDAKWSQLAAAGA